MYRTLILPEHRRLNDAIVEMGALPCMHVCGDPREVVADFADEHTQAWEACNLALEMVETAREMGDGLALIGSCNLRVDFSTRTVSEEEVRQRTREVIEAFAPLGNFAFMGASMMLPAEESMHFKQIADEEAIALGTDYYRR